MLSLPAKILCLPKPRKTTSSVLGFPQHSYQKRSLPFQGLLPQFIQTTLMTFSFWLCFVVPGVQRTWSSSFPIYSCDWQCCDTSNLHEGVNVFFHSLDYEIFCSLKHVIFCGREEFEREGRREVPMENCSSGKFSSIEISKGRNTHFIHLMLLLSVMC